MDTIPTSRCPCRSALKLLFSTLLACTLFVAAPCFSADETTAPMQEERDELAIDMDMVATTWTGDLDGMVERGMIRILTPYSKTLYFVDKGTPRGLTHDAFRLFEEDLNKKLAKEKKLRHKHLKVRVVFVPVGRDELLPALAAGRGDIAAANLTITPERLQLVDFANPTYSNVKEVLVSSPASPAVAVVEDLSGKEVFVRRSSSFYESLVALNRRLAAANKKPVVIREASEALESEDLLEMVNAGLIPFTVVDKHIGDFWKQIFPKIKLDENLALRAEGRIAWAVRKNNPQLKAALNDFLARNPEGSKDRNILLTRYLKNTKYVKDAASENERKKFLTLIDFFRKYGEKYSVDWLLMVAQGYQESQLDQGARSKVGAIGVMQVMPATGKELNVGDISKVEPNIHAGIKYMRWMIDQYYGSEPMTSLDKALFSFASYNAGASRIGQLRKEAAKRGLDPNVWFHNVEYVAAEKIGAETVTYVSNIYKYYIAYNLIMEARAKKEKAGQQMKGDKK